MLANLFPYIFVSVFFSLGGVKNFAQNLITLSYLLHIVYSQMTYMNFWGEWGDGGGELNDHIGSWGRGGQDRPKKDQIIFMLPYWPFELLQKIIIVRLLAC